MTTFDMNLPLALYKANLELWLRTTELLQENRQNWLELGTRNIEENIDETRAEAQEVFAAQSWEPIALEPNVAAWRLLQRNVSNLQGVAETALLNQNAFSAGLQKALTDWQRETAAALSVARNAMPLAASIEEWFASLGAPLAVAAPAPAPAAAVPRTPAAPAKVARKRAR